MHVVGSSGGACAGAYLFLDAGGPNKQGLIPATAETANHCTDSLLRMYLNAGALNKQDLPPVEAEIANPCTVSLLHGCQLACVCCQDPL